MVLNIFTILTWLVAIGSSSAYVMSWSLAEVDDAIKEGKTCRYELRSFVEQYKEGMKTVLVLDPSISILTWPLEDLRKYINGFGSPLDPGFLTELSFRRDVLLNAIESGKRWDSIGIVTTPEKFDEALQSINI